MLIVACSPESPQAEVSNVTPERTAALNLAKLKNPAICDYNKMEEQGIEHMSVEDAANVCETMTASLGHQPSIDLLQEMINTMFAFKIKGLNDGPKDITYQVMNIIESRNLLNSDDATIKNTMNVIFKCYNGSQGHVTPKDISIALRAMPDKSKTISDDSIYFLSAVIQEDKKNRGE